MKPILVPALLVTLFLSVGQAADPPRKMHPLVPSLPQLTKEQEDKIDQIIQRFILFDTGQLKGADGQKAQAEFAALGPEAFFALIRGLAAAAAVEGSCPMVTIAKKLQGILKGSNDPALMAFARENIGAGVERSPHMGVIRELRMTAMLRQREAARGGGKPVDAGGEGKIVIRPRQPGDTSLAGKSTLELAQASRSAKGDQLKGVLNELEKRSGESAIAALVAAMGADGESQIRYLAQELLVKNLSRQADAALKDKLKDKRPEVRSAAAWVVADKRLPFGTELIDLLADKDWDVVQAARQALTRLADSETDYGPNRNVTDDERAEAIRQWRGWWVKKSGE